MRVLALSVLVLALALAISRAGLLVHEVVGHGVVAHLLGGEVTGWSLHALGGGWVGFKGAAAWSEGARYAVQLGGIVVELAAAGALAGVARRARGVAGLGVAAAAWALAIHAGWYLAAGTYHGFGDGARLHHALGAARLAVVVPAALAIVAGAFVAGRAVGVRLRRHAPAATPRRQLALTLAAVALGAGAHGALTGAERALREDRAYRAVMRTAGERAVERELAVRAAAAERAGRAIDARELAAARRALERRHRQLPVGAGLAVAVVVAALAGIARSRPAPDATPPPPRALAAAVAVAVALIAVVLIVDALAP